MEQEDYLIRQINKLGQVLGKLFFDLIGLKHKGQTSIGVEMTNHVLKTELDFNIQELMDIPTEGFVDTLLLEERLNNDNFEKLAEVLLLIAEDKEGEEKRLLYERCLAIFEYLRKVGKVYSPDRQQKIEEIRKCL